MAKAIYLPLFSRLRTEGGRSNSHDYPFQKKKKYSAIPMAASPVRKARESVQIKYSAVRISRSKKSSSVRTANVTGFSKNEWLIISLSIQKE